MMAKMQPGKGFSVFIKAVEEFNKQFEANLINATIVISDLSQDLLNLLIDLRVDIQHLPFTEANEELFWGKDIVVNASLTLEPFGLTMVDSGHWP